MMKPDKAFSDLIGRIYDCALDTGLWPEVLAEITDALGGVMGDVSIIDPLAGRLGLAAFHNWPEDVIESLRRHSHLSPSVSLGLVVPLCQPICTSRDLDMRAFHNSRFWQSCFAGRGYYDYMTAAVTRSGTSFASWGVMGDEAQGAWSDENLEFARIISPHIRRSVRSEDPFGIDLPQDQHTPSAGTCAADARARNFAAAVRARVSGHRASRD